MNAPLYTLDILRLASTLSDPASLPGAALRGEARSKTCGSRVETALTVDVAGRVDGLSQKVHACAFGQASAALFEQAAPGLDMARIAEGRDMVGNWLEGRAELSGRWSAFAVLRPAIQRASRHSAILLPFRAALDALSRIDR